MYSVHELVISIRSICCQAGRQERTGKIELLSGREGGPSTGIPHATRDGRYREIDPEARGSMVMRESGTSRSLARVGTIPIV